MAAENGRAVSRVLPPRTSFNEAAANGRGKRARTGDGDTERRASMRPRRMAAENAADHRSSCPPPSCFNEAAANGRGKRRARGLARLGHDRFNEAAANGRGKRGHDHAGNLPPIGPLQ